MAKVDLVLIVEYNAARALDTRKNLENAKIADSIKIAVNCEHALLCIDHLDLYMRLKKQRIIVLLNLDTPYMDGLAFMDHFNQRNYSSSENILVIALKDFVSSQTLDKAKQKGIKEFISTPIDIPSLNENIKMHFGNLEAGIQNTNQKKSEMGMKNRPIQLR